MEEPTRVALKRGRELPSKDPQEVQPVSKTKSDATITSVYIAWNCQGWLAATSLSRLLTTTVERVKLLNEGATEGVSVGECVVGVCVGRGVFTIPSAIGYAVGTPDGPELGCTDGIEEGAMTGCLDGCKDGKA
jgi:hypothetical protein